MDQRGRGEGRKMRETRATTKQPTVRGVLFCFPLINREWNRYHRPTTGLGQTAQQ